MTEVVTDQLEISLNGTRLRLARPVQSILASVYPAKLVIGDTTRDSNPNASVLALSSWDGGIGVNLEADSAPTKRAWWSTLNLRYRNHLVLPALATASADSGVAGSWAVGAIGALSNEIYAAFGTDVRKYNNDTDSWSASLATLPGVATSALTFRLNNVVYLAFATSSGYTYTSDGASWSTSTRDAVYLTYWNNQLWGIDNTGLLWSSVAIGVESDDAQLPLPDSYVTGLFTARDAAGDQIIYAATKVGLWAHSADDRTFLETELALPLHPTGGMGAAKWRDSIYFPAGLGIYKYVNGASTATIQSMGPDKDDGLPSDKRGVVRQMLPTLNELLVLVDATVAAEATSALNLFIGEALGSQVVAVIDGSVGYSAILGWNEQGWEVRWLSGLNAHAISAALVSDAYDVYRLWWAHNQRIYYMSLPVDIINPSQVTTFKYAAGGEHITPWFNMGQVDVEKLALRLKVDAHDMSATETAVVDYATDLSEAWTNLGTITSDGLTTYTLPSSANPVGVSFRWIRFRLTLARGSTTTLTPHIHSLSLEYRKKMSVKWGMQVTVDLSKEYKGNSPMQLLAAVKTAISSSNMIEFTYRDDTSGAHTLYVDVASVTGLEYTGHDWRGHVSLALVER